MRQTRSTESACATAYPRSFEEAGIVPCGRCGGGCMSVEDCASRVYIKTLDAPVSDRWARFCWWVEHLFNGDQGNYRCQFCLELRHADCPVPFKYGICGECEDRLGPGRTLT